MSSAKPIGDNRTTNGAASAATSPPAYLHKKFKRAASTVVDDHLDNEFEQSNSATTSAAAAGVASDNQVIVHPGSSGSMAVDGSPITTYKPRFHRAALHQSNSNKYNTNTPNDHHHHNLESAGVSTSQKRRLSANLGRQRDDNIENRFSPNKLHQAVSVRILTLINYIFSNLDSYIQLRVALLVSILTIFVVFHFTITANSSSRIKEKQ